MYLYEKSEEESAVCCRAEVIAWYLHLPSTSSTLEAHVLLYTRNVEWDFVHWHNCSFKMQWALYLEHNEQFLDPESIKSCSKRATSKVTTNVNELRRTAKTIAKYGLTILDCVITLERHSYSCNNTTTLLCLGVLVRNDALDPC